MSFLQRVLKMFLSNIFRLAGFLIACGGLIALGFLDPWWYGLLIIAGGVLVASIGQAIIK